MCQSQVGKRDKVQIPQLHTQRPSIILTKPLFLYSLPYLLGALQKKISFPASQPAASGSRGEHIRPSPLPYSSAGTGLPAIFLPSSGLPRPTLPLPYSLRGKLPPRSLVGREGGLATGRAISYASF